MPQPAYDPVETLHWMLAGVRAEVLSETTTGPTGRARRKTKAQRDADRVRFETLCEALWNVSGRPEDLETMAERLLHAA
jgi:hypothetical protein